MSDHGSILILFQHSVYYTHVIDLLIYIVSIFFIKYKTYDCFSCFSHVMKCDIYILFCVI